MVAPVKNPNVVRFEYWSGSEDCSEEKLVIRNGFVTFALSFVPSRITDPLAQRNPSPKVAPRPPFVCAVPWKNSALESPEIAFDFANVAKPSSAFKRVVRDLEFDVAELAIVTYLMAKAHGKQLVLFARCCVVIRACLRHPSMAATIGTTHTERTAQQKLSNATQACSQTWPVGMLIDRFK